jgi:rSAM/selenodomain-associated transferase 1
MRTLGVFCSQPQPGHVMPRLAEHLGPQSAIDLSTAFLDDLTLEFRTVGERRVLGYSPAESAGYFEHFSRYGYDLWPQPDGDLGTRMNSFFLEALHDSDDRAVLIGSDSPTIPSEYVRQAFERLDEYDCVIGPSMDGAYYLIALRRSTPTLFENIVWNGSSVLSQTVKRIAEADLSLTLLPPWYDIEDLDDLWMLAGHIRAMTRSGITHPCPVTASVLHKLRLGS